MSTELKKLAFEDHFVHKRRRSSHHSYKEISEAEEDEAEKSEASDQQRPPAIQVWRSDEEDEVSGGLAFSR